MSQHARSAPRHLFRALWRSSLLLALLALLGVFLIYPIVLMVGGAFTEHAPGAEGGRRFTLTHLGLIFEDPELVRGLVNAVESAGASTVLCLLVAVPLAVMAAKYRYPFKGTLNAIILVPLILPPFVGAIGLQALLGREGSINSLFGTSIDFLGTAKFWGVVIANALHLYPIIYMNVTAALANLDPALEEAAENLGSGPVRRFFRVTLPLIRPGIFAGATIVFIWAFTELGTPLVFDYPQITPVQIFQGLKEIESSPQPYALTVVMLVAVLAIYATGKLAFGGRGHAMYSKASRAAAEKPLAAVPGWAVTGAFIVVAVLSVLPHIGVILVSIGQPGQWNRTVLPSSYTGNNFVLALSHPDAFGSIVNSLVLSVQAVVLAMSFGLLAAYVIVRTRLPGRGLLDALCMLPLAVPGLVMAFGFVAMTLRWPFGKGDPLDGLVSILGADPNPAPLLVACFAVRRLPYIVRSAVAGLEQTSGELEEAAMNLGASRITAVRRVILPLIAANLIAGALLAFSFTMLAVSEPLVMAQQQEDLPITKAIYAFLTRMGDGPSIASAMGVWGMALLAVTLVGASVLMGKKMGSIFRV